MSLVAGARLGPYEIVAPLGVGGMGEVYRARDTRLERTVAIKVLPAHVASNDDLRQRLEREARAVSSLSHPHICTLHDVGREGNVDYLVMEYLEGETLLDRLEKGPLPIGQALRHAVEIADALDKAHRQGIIHRDLKPGNIMLTKTGAKLLDFGLAKVTAPDVAGAQSVLATAQRPLTEAGTLLGTFQYMAPEQLEGREADARTDVFAFGAVLYEMVTGRRAFEGKSQASLVSAIMSQEPVHITAAQPMAPPALERIVRTCLAKDPDDRWQSAHDLAAELRWIAEAGSQAGVPAPVVARRKSRERWAWALATGLGLLAAVAAGIRALVRHAAQASTRRRSPTSIVDPAPTATRSTVPARGARRQGFAVDVLRGRVVGLREPQHHLRFDVEVQEQVEQHLEAVGELQLAVHPKCLLPQPFQVPFDLLEIAEVLARLQRLHRIARHVDQHPEQLIVIGLHGEPAFHRDDPTDRHVEAEAKRLVHFFDQRADLDGLALGRRLLRGAVGQRGLAECDRALERAHQLGRKALYLRIRQGRQLIGEQLRRRQ